MTYYRFDMLQDHMVRHLQSLYPLSICGLMMWNVPDQTARSLYRGRHTASHSDVFLNPFSPIHSGTMSRRTARLVVWRVGGGKGREGRGENPRGTVHLDLFFIVY